MLLTYKNLNFLAFKAERALFTSKIYKFTQKFPFKEEKTPFEDLSVIGSFQEKHPFELKGSLPIYKKHKIGLGLFSLSFIAFITSKTPYNFIDIF